AVRRGRPASSGLGYFLLIGLLFFAFGGVRRELRAIQQAHQRKRRVVALPEAVLEDAQVAALPLRVARSEFAEELRHRVAVAQAVISEAPVGERRRLAQRDHRLDDAPQLLRLG